MKRTLARGGAFSNVNRDGHLSYPYWQMAVAMALVFDAEDSEDSEVARISGQTLAEGRWAFVQRKRRVIG